MKIDKRTVLEIIRDIINIILKGIPANLAIQKTAQKYGLEEEEVKKIYNKIDK